MLFEQKPSLNDTVSMNSCGNISAGIFSILSRSVTYKILNLEIHTFFVILRMEVYSLIELTVNCFRLIHFLILQIIRTTLGNLTFSTMYIDKKYSCNK